MREAVASSVGADLDRTRAVGEQTFKQLMSDIERRVRAGICPGGLAGSASRMAQRMLRSPSQETHSAMQRWTLLTGL